MNLNELTNRELSLICNCFLFCGIGEREVCEALAADDCVLKSFPAGGYIYDGGVGIVLDGAVKAQTLSGRHKLSVRVLNPGESFGVSALFGDGSYATELTSKANSRIIFLAQPLVEALMASDFRIAENYIRFLSSRIRFLNRKIAYLAAGTVEEMLALHLLDTDGHMYVDSFSALSELMGVGRASLYRTLDKLEDMGYITRTLHEIIILDKNGLETLVK